MPLQDIFLHFLQRNIFFAESLKGIIAVADGRQSAEAESRRRQLAMIDRPAAAEASHPTTYRGGDSPSAHKV